MGEVKPVLVTGGGGFLGKAIVRRLIGQGLAVRSFSRRFYRQLDRWGVQQFPGDLADFHAVSLACEGVETVFHVAARPGVWGDYDSFYRPNVLGTNHVIAACQKQAVSRLIYTSSPSVIFDGSDMEGVDESAPYPTHYPAHYPQTKALAEQAVRRASNGLKTIILRPHLIWGPGDNHLVPRILARAHQLRRIGKGNKRVDTLYIDNAAQAHILAWQQLKAHPKLSGRIYFISQDDPIGLWEMVNAILKAGGKPPVTRRIPHWLARGLGAMAEAVYGLMKWEREPPLTRFVADEMATAHWFDISAAKQELGYQPTVSIAEGLKRLQGELEAKDAP